MTSSGEPLHIWATAGTSTKDYSALENAHSFISKDTLHRYLLDPSSFNADWRLGLSANQLSAVPAPDLKALLIDPKLAALFMAELPADPAAINGREAMAPLLREVTKIDYSGARSTVAALQFCAKHSLEQALQKAIELARAHFIISGLPSVYLEHDAEDGEEFIVLEIQVKSDACESVLLYNKYALDWARCVELPAMAMIRLIYNTI